MKPTEIYRIVYVVRGPEPGLKHKPLAPGLGRLCL